MSKGDFVELGLGEEAAEEQAMLLVLDLVLCVAYQEFDSDSAGPPLKPPPVQPHSAPASTLTPNVYPLHPRPKPPDMTNSYGQVLAIMAVRSEHCYVVDCGWPSSGRFQPLSTPRASFFRLFFRSFDEFSAIFRRWRGSSLISAGWGNRARARLSSCLS